MDLELSNYPQETDFSWTRFWAPIDVQVGEHDFLPDPEGFLGNKHIVTFEKIKHVPGLVLLGNPGIGKSRATQRIVVDFQDSGIPCLYVALHRYGSFSKLKERLQKNEIYQRWLENTGALHLFLDGLDEARLNDKNFDHDIVHFLEELTDAQRKRLYLRITCRSAELPTDFVQELHILRSPRHSENVQLFQLTKLRQVDVAFAAERLAIEPQAFLSALDASGATSFAAHPITLDMLFKIYQSEGHLPHNRAEIYSQGCWHLAQEVSEKRRQDGFQGEFEVHQRLAAARHLAATTVFCNRHRIYSGADFLRQKDTILLHDCFLEDISWQKPEHLLVETLRTALFIGSESHFHLWSHRSYGEYLAAEFATNAGMPLEQIQSLLINHADSEQHIAPELRETAAWIATLHEDVFDWILENEPVVLLNSDSIELTDEHKANLVDRLMQSFDTERREDHLLMWNAYKQFSYPGLGIQLKTYLQDQSLSESTRDFAMTIAVYCNITSIDDVLIAIALDPNEVSSLRIGALSALRRPNHDNTDMEGLRPLVFASKDYNVDTDLIARAMDILWPNHLSADELFSKLHLPKFDDFVIGSSYDMLIGGNLTRFLSIDDLPIALNWLMENMPDRDEEISVGGQQLIASILSKAWDNLDVDDVRIPFARVALIRLRRFSPIMSTPYGLLSHDNEVKLRNYAEEIRQDTSKRRNLLITILGWFSPEALRDWKVVSDLKSSRDLQFVIADDVSWLIDQVRKVKDDNWREAFLILIDLFLPGDYSIIHHGVTPEELATAATVYMACETDPLLQERFSGRFDAVPLRSARAQQCRAWVEKQNELQKRRSEKTPSTVDLRVNIEECIAKCEADSVNWWKLEQWLRANEYGRYWDNIWDLRQGGGWQAIQSDENIISRIVNIAYSYIEEQNPYILDYKENTPITNWPPAMAGYRGFVLLGLGQLLDKVTRNAWERWADAIVFNVGNKPQELAEVDGMLLNQAFMYASERLLARLAEELNDDINEYRLTALLHRFSHAPAEPLEAILVSYFETLPPESNTFFVALQFLNHRHVQAAHTIVFSHLETLTTNETNRPLKRRIFSIMSKYTDTSTWWKHFWSLLEADSVNQKEYLEAIIDWHYNPYLRHLDEKELCDLYKLAINIYPYSEDQEFHGGSVPDWHIKQEWRDSILNELAGRGTKTGIEFLTTLINEQSSIPSIRYLLHQAWERYRTESWNPPQPSTVLQLASDSQKHYLGNAKQLLDIIILHLKQIEDKFKLSQNKQHALWHRQADGSFLPVEREERFANAVAEWLRERLPRVVINREPQVHHGIYSTQGDNTDIVVEALNDADELLTVIIEAKCCWYQNIHPRMQTQLVDQYLSHHPTCQYGLYLVGYFASAHWNASDVNRAQLCSRKSKVRLLQELEVTKERLDLPVSTTVEVFVFDASI
mgnify:CR=1 FL=1